MADIRVEFIPIQRFHLGWFGLDHMQLVYQRGEFASMTLQDTWYVLEGLIGAGKILGVEGVNAHTTLSDANFGLFGLDLEQQIGTPSGRGSRIIQAFDAGGAWATMASYGALINDNQFPYLGYGPPGTPFPTFNSSSVISTLAWQIGVDINVNLPRGIRLSPGTSTLLGTPGNDTLSLPTDNFDTLAGGAGDDDISGSNSPSRVDKLFGGAGNDLFHWSKGFNIINGGQPTLAQSADGQDTIDYGGAGTIRVKGNRQWIAGLSPEYIVSFTGLGGGGGTDWLYSIEVIQLDPNTDRLILGEDVGVIPKDLAFNFGGQDSGGKGDEADFSFAQTGVRVVADASNEVQVTLAGGSGAHGWWLADAEWITGSAKADEIHLAAAMHGADGGEGDDIIDARLVTPGSGGSPQGYDAEIGGGAGDDVLISNAGRTLARGGAGHNTFVLSAVGGQGVQTEFVIDDATPEDRLLIPYNVFNGSIGSADGSTLMALLGGSGDWGQIDATTAGRFVFRTEDQIAGSDDFTNGVIPFCGQILYFREGSDLVIHITPATRTDITLGNPEDGTAFTITVPKLEQSLETIVRVRNFAPGDLGITFEALQPTGDTITDLHGHQLGTFSNLDSIIQRVTNEGKFFDPLSAIPTAPGRPPPDPALANPPLVVSSISANHHDSHTDSRDTLVTGGPGDDIITTGSGNDRIDGGAGADTMSGGAGDDTYVVDSTGDRVIEAAAKGNDTVESSIDYTLPDNVENLTLTGSARQGSGNALANRLIGTFSDNVLSGGGGNDTLYGAGGNDTLIGGTGDDGYVYNAAAPGDITIVDTGPATETNTLALIGGIAVKDVSAYRLVSAPADLVLVIAQGGSITIKDYLSGAGIEQVTFDDNTVWARSDLDALAAAAPVLGFSPPRAQDDFDIAVYGATTIPAEAFLGNDGGGAGALRITSVGAVSIGTAAVDQNGDVVIQPPAGYEGTVTFSYTVADANGGTAHAQATVTILPQPGPVAADDTIAGVDRNTVLSIDPSRLTANDIGTGLAVTAVSNAVHGQAAIDAAGRIVFTPEANYAGAASFSYTVADTNGATSSAQVSLSFVVLGLTTSGTPQADRLNGGAFNDVIYGGGGDDQINGGAGADFMYGGDGNDTYYVDNAGDRVFETNPDAASGGFDKVIASVNFTLPDYVEQLTLSGAATTGTGNSAANVLYGGSSGLALTLDGGAGDDKIYGSAAGFNTLIGGAGNDSLTAHGGHNVLRGGDGNDTYYIDSASDQVIETNADPVTGGFDIVNASFDYVLPDNVEQLTLSGAATTGTGNSAANLLYGGTSGLALTLDGGAGDDKIYGSAAGFNTLTGGAGNDSLTAHGGHNVLRGGDGNDIYYIESASDQVIETNADPVTGGFDIVNASFDYVLPDNVEQLTLSGAATTGTGNSANNVLYGGSSLVALTLDGGAGDDKIYGSTVGFNTLTGGAGNDSLTAHGGHNVLRGGDGNDIYYIESASDQVIETNADPVTGGRDIIVATINYALPDNVEQLTLSGAATTGTGNSGDNVLYGGASKFSLTLDGGAGNDRLVGSAQDDVLTGGAGDDVLDLTQGGNDILRYWTADFGKDVVYGFDSDPVGGQDRIDVSGRGFTAQSLGSGILVTSAGKDTLITIGTDTIRLVGVDSRTIGAGSFVF